MPAFISESQYASKPRKIHQGIAAAHDLASFAEKEQKSMAILDQAGDAIGQHKQGGHIVLSLGNGIVVVYKK